MRKRFSSVLVALLLILILSAQAAYAALPRNARAFPTLGFHGNIAQCSGICDSDSLSDSISATLTLYNGTGPVASWSATGTGHVTLSGTCQVDFDRRYRLELAVSVNGVPQPVQSVSAICPRP